MDYNLDSLGDRNFEHLTQAVVAKHIGPRLMVFGDGPDGGREATWRGEAPSFGSENDWDGYGVLQAKFKVHTEDPARNLIWLKSSIQKELTEWARPDSKRHEKPDFLLFVTNVRLSSVPDKGKDEMHSFVRNQLGDLGLQIKDVRVWDHYEVAAQLDDSDSIRKRYAAFVTPGDVIASLLQEVEGLQESFGQAIATYTARCLSDENLLNLTQAGTAGDGQVTIGDVFIDLPADLPDQPWLLSEETELDSGGAIDDVDIDGFEFSFEPAESRSGIAKHLINDFNHIPDARREGKPSTHRTVLIGGPGQGKSTVTQWLAQMYRTEFLRGSPTFDALDISTIASQTEARRSRLGLPAVQARRWPIRIVLTELADYLAKKPDRSLLHYMAHKISTRSSFEVDQLMLRKWLAGYPWLLLIDGLDEVPASSNREQVMVAIRDFFLDVAAIGGDVAAVATTRPQGYGEEFSSREYRHFNLNPLTVDEALSYAEGLVAGRVGAGTPTAAKVLARLARASQEEHTKKLFESPLQVTILEVLLEKLGKAPSDRSRLYSAYYNVISQREQEKSDALSDLLQRYESDVDYLHRRIGFELQQRGSEVGETSSSLTTDEFDEFIVERFRDQGHTEDEVRALSKSFSELVTDRLVFLAKLQADRIGFELRSLQEFMAGEFIVALPEREVITEIQRISIAPYWRNVVLFAIGSIFAKREHLRAEVVLLCDRLNDEPNAAAVVLPGAELSLDVLRDGSCLSMPKYARRLAKNALRLMSSPRGTGSRTLLFMSDTNLSDLFWQELESLSSATTSEWINRASLLSALWNGENDRAEAGLRRLFEAADAELRFHLIEWAWDTRDLGLADVIGDRFLECPPSVFFSRNSLRPREMRRRSEAALPTWIKHLLDLSDGVHRADRLDGSLDWEVAPVRAFFQPLGLDEDVWEWVRGLDTTHDGWVALKSLADFSLAPSAGKLADALDAMSHASPDFSPALAPWPFYACIQHARNASSADPDTNTPQVLTELSEAARRGDLGDQADWLSAQERWEGSIAISEENIGPVLAQHSPLPLSPGLASAGIAPTAYSYSVHGGRQDATRLQLMALLGKIVATDKPDLFWLGLATFFGSVLARHADPSNQHELDLQFTALRAKFLTDRPQLSWFGWLELVPMTDGTLDLELLEVVGSHRELVGSSFSAERMELLFKRAREGAGNLPLARLVFKSNPALLEAVPVDWLSALVSDSDPQLVGVLAGARRLLAAQETDIWTGQHDDDLARIASAGESAFDASWFLQLLEERDSDQNREVAARGAQLLASSHPSAAERFLEIAWKRTKSMAAPLPD